VIDRVCIDFCFSITDLSLAVMTDGRHVPYCYNRIGGDRSDSVCGVQKVCGGKTETRNQHGLPETPETILDCVLLGVLC